MGGEWAGPAGTRAGAPGDVGCLGETGRWVSALGDDPFGQSILDALAEAGADDHVRIDPDRPTIREDKVTG